MFSPAGVYFAHGTPRCAHLSIVGQLEAGGMMLIYVVVVVV